MHSLFFGTLLTFFTFLPTLMPTEADVSLTVEFSNLRSSKGKVLIALFNQAEGFPKNSQRAAYSQKVSITNQKAQAVFTDLPPGTYAIACFQDENNNERLDTNFLGIPTEGFGFSNNPTVLTGAPGYDECRFEVSSNQQLVIKVKYLL